MRNKAHYRSLSVDQILELDDERRRDYLETLIREHVSSENEAEVFAALDARIVDEYGRERIEEVDPDDADELLTELLDNSTDDGLAEVLRGLMSGAHSSAG